jgi:hypothetical protein
VPDERPRPGLPQRGRPRRDSAWLYDRAADGDVAALVDEILEGYYYEERCEERIEYGHRFERPVPLPE